MKKHSYTEAVSLLQKLIGIPSFSREEAATAALIGSYLEKNGIDYTRSGNNIWAKNLFYDPAKPTLLLCSHHDTVKPAADWTKDPFHPELSGGKLYGLGSNDAGASLVCLIACFLSFYGEKNLPMNLVLLAAAEEEISGSGGVASVLPLLGKTGMAIVGEPTQMQMAVAEKGLLVIDCIAAGKAGHAARNESVNAIYRAMKDIDWISNYHFPLVSEWLGETRMNVTLIEAGKQHNVIPGECRFTIDLRLTEKYQPEEVISILRENISSEIKPRSLRLRPSFIAETHPLVKAGKKCGMKSFGSPTLSDQALLPFPSVKIGPGDSVRSHTADEFIFLSEIEEGIEKYTGLINAVSEELKTGKVEKEISFQK